MNMDEPPTQPVVRKPTIFNSPLSTFGFPSWLTYILAVIGLIYVLNPTLGVFELLPDNLPAIGNLDEGLAYALVWAGLMELVEGRKKRA